MTSASLSSNAVQTSAIYLRFTATNTGGSTLGANNARFCSITNNTSFGGCNLSIFHDTVAGEMQADLYGGGITAGGNSGTISVSPSAGDLVEIFAPINTSAFTFSFTVYKNSTLVGSTTSIPWTSGVPSTYGDGGSNPSFFINQRGPGADTNAQSFAAACYASGSPTITDFRDWFTLTGFHSYYPSSDGSRFYPS